MMQTWGKNKKEQKIESMDKAFELFKKGFSYRAIAGELGISKSSVERWINTRPVSPGDQLSGTLGQRDKAYVQDNEVNGTEEDGDDQGKIENELSDRDKRDNLKKMQGQKDALNKKGNEDLQNALNPVSFPFLQAKYFGTEGQGDNKLSGTDGTNEDGLNESVGQKDNQDKALKWDNEAQRTERAMINKYQDKSLGQSGTAGTKRTDQNAGFSEPENKNNEMPGQKDTKVWKRPEPRTITNHLGQKVTINFPDFFGEIYDGMEIFLNDEDYEEAQKPVSYFDQERMETANRHLKRWIMKIFRLSQKKIVMAETLKELLKEMKEYQGSYHYSELPRLYKYRAFLEKIIARIKELVLEMKIKKASGTRKLEIDESLEKEMKDILFQLS